MISQLKYYSNKFQLWYRKRALLVERNGVFSLYKGNNGFVLIIVLIMSTMLITISAEFLVNAQSSIQYIKRLKSEAQAESYAFSGLKVAQLILDTDEKGQAAAIIRDCNNDRNTDTYRDIWAYKFPPFSFENGKIDITIRDEQSKLNLNAVTNQYVAQTKYYDALKRFFYQLGFDYTYPDAIVDWIDPDENKSQYGAETFDYYSALPVPYKSKNRSMDSIDELMMIKGFTPYVFYGLAGGNIGKDTGTVDDNAFIKDFTLDFSGETGTEESINPDEIPTGPEKSRNLKNYLRTTGDSTDWTVDINKINVNTAPYRILLSLADDMTDDKAASIIKKRAVKPISSVEELADIITDQSVRKNMLTVSSKLFLISSTGESGGFKITVLGVYNRTNKKYTFLSVQ